MIDWVQLNVGSKSLNLNWVFDAALTDPPIEADQLMSNLPKNDITWTNEAIIAIDAIWWTFVEESKTNPIKTIPKNTTAIANRSLTDQTSPHWVQNTFSL